MIGLFGDFYFVLLWKHRLRFPAETLGILSVLPASTFFLSWCAPVVLQCLSSSRVAFSLVRVDYSDFETGESVLLPLSHPKCSLPSGAADLLCVEWLPEAAAVGLHQLSCPFYRLTSALFLWHYFVGMLTSCFDSKKWVCINWENVLAHLRILYEPIRQLPPSCNWDLAGWSQWLTIGGSSFLMLLYVHVVGFFYSGDDASLGSQLPFFFV